MQTVEEFAVPAAPREVRGHVMATPGPAGAVKVSATAMFFRVTLPVLLTRNE